MGGNWSRRIGWPVGYKELTWIRLPTQTAIGVHQLAVRMCASVSSVREVAEQGQEAVKLCQQRLYRSVD